MPRPAPQTAPHVAPHVALTTALTAALAAIAAPSHAAPSPAAVAVVQEWKALCFDTNGDSAKVKAIAPTRGWTRVPPWQWRKRIEGVGPVELATVGYAGPIYKTAAVTDACGFLLKRPPRDLVEQMSAVLGVGPDDVRPDAPWPSSNWYFQTVQGVRTLVPKLADDRAGEGSFDAAVAQSPVTVVTIRRADAGTYVNFSVTYKDPRSPEAR